jgi:116 kDa U5 small nuclear ribonucleoprotein component
VIAQHQKVFAPAARRAGEGEALYMQFILEPLYKIFSCVIGEETKTIEKMLSQFKIKLKPSSYSKDIKPLLTDVCSAVFGEAAGLTEMMVNHIPSSKQGAPAKVEHLYLGPPVRYSPCEPDIQESDV